MSKTFKIFSIFIVLYIGTGFIIVVISDATYIDSGLVLILWVYYFYIFSALAGFPIILLLAFLVFLIWLSYFLEKKLRNVELLKISDIRLYFKRPQIVKRFFWHFGLPLIIFFVFIFISEIVIGSFILITWWICLFVISKYNNLINKTK